MTPSGVTLSAVEWACPWGDDVAAPSHRGPKSCD